MTTPASSNRLAIIVLAAAGALCLATAALVVWRAGRGERQPPQEAYEFAGVVFERTDYETLKGWRADDASSALSAFLLSCEKIAGKDDAAPFNPREAFAAAGLAPGDFAGAVGEWRPLCARAREVARQTYADDVARTSAARLFFEGGFDPVKILREMRPRADGPAAGSQPVFDGKGLFTGYFEPVYPAAAARSETYSAPVYPRPADLVSVDLGLFGDRFAGERTAGRVENGRLKPYESRAAINGGALAGVVEPIAFMSPNDLFFLQIQGSGRLVIGEDEVRVGYDGQNGHPYYAIGRSLIERGALTRETVSMQSIRTWLDIAAPAAARALREENASYVFFRRLANLPDPALGPLGAQGVQLTAGRSIAVDRRFHGFGCPIWLQWEEKKKAPDKTAGAGQLAQKRTPQKATSGLFIAQDVGGAIRGPMRADLFIGAGVEAGDVAGRFNTEGEMVVLLPKAAAARLSYRNPEP